MNGLMVLESPIEQGTRERISYSADCTPWGGAPSAATVIVYDLSDGDRDVTSTVMDGTVSVAGNVITLPFLHSLARGHSYFVSVGFTIGGQALAFGIQVSAVR